MKKPWSKWTKKELLDLPCRERSAESEYDSILLVNSGMKHESGYSYMAIIGCNNCIPIEIACFCDDFRYDCYTEAGDPIDRSTSFAFDCSPRGVIQLHVRGKIGVSYGCDTTLFYIKKDAYTETASAVAVGSVKTLHAIKKAKADMLGTLIEKAEKLYGGIK